MELCRVCLAVTRGAFCAKHYPAWLEVDHRESSGEFVERMRKAMSAEELVLLFERERLFYGTDQFFQEALMYKR